MAAPGSLAVRLNEQKLVKQTFWTSELLVGIKGDIREAGRHAFRMGYLGELEEGGKEWAMTVERERLPPPSTPPYLRPPNAENKEEQVGY